MYRDCFLMGVHVVIGIVGSGIDTGFVVGNVVVFLSLAVDLLFGDGNVAESVNVRMWCE